MAQKHAIAELRLRAGAVACTRDPKAANDEQYILQISNHFEQTPRDIRCHRSVWGGGGGMRRREGGLSVELKPELGSSSERNKRHGRQAVAGVGGRGEIEFIRD